MAFDNVIKKSVSEKLFLNEFINETKDYTQPHDLTHEYIKEYIKYLEHESDIPIFFEYHTTRNPEFLHDGKIYVTKKDIIGNGINVKDYCKLHLGGMKQDKGLLNILFTIITHHLNSNYSNKTIVIYSVWVDILDSVHIPSENIHKKNITLKLAVL